MGVGGRTLSEGVPVRHYGGISQGMNAFDNLTDQEINARIRVASAQLRRLGAFQDTRAIPMAHLTDDQLDERIGQVEEELRRLNEGDAAGSREVSCGERDAVIRQLEVLDYLIEHADATISPAAALDALDYERVRWAQEFFAE